MLSEATDDEIVAEMRRRLERGTVGFAGLISPHQMDAQGAWHRVCLLSDQWSNTPGRYDEAPVRELRALIQECACTVQIPPGIYAINTTFLGKSTAMQDHAPKPVQALRQSQDQSRGMRVSRGGRNRG